MSIVPSIPASAMAPNDSKTDFDTSASPPVTPPTKSSGLDAGSVRPSLPSPPSSSSSRHSRPLDHQRDQDQNQDKDQDQDRRTPLDEDSAIRNIARRLSPSRPPNPTLSRSIQKTSPGAAPKTHSSSSSMSSSASNHLLPPLANKHVAMTKTKTFGHLTRSTSSEVDNEVANALASGRSIVSKTDWKEEDAQYLVQLIETQFPKGNIIWDWVGQQMTSRGFTKSQCRSKWKRIRTKVLHGGDAPSKERDNRDHLRDQEHDELIDDDDDDMGRPLLVEPRQEFGKWSQRQGYDRQLDGKDYSDPYRSRSYETRGPYNQHPREDYYYGRDRKEGHRASTSYHSGRQAAERGAMEDELWSDDDHAGRHIHDSVSKRYSQDYHTHPSSPRQHHRRQSSSHHARDETADDSLRSISAIAATPTSFGKIEWKPEDSDYLVHLIESKFSSRKVDWAWVSKQMEGRGYDRTQCKSRWWRVQHRQNQNSQQNSSSSHHGSSSQLLSRSKHQDLALNGPDSNGMTSSKDDKGTLSDEEIHQSNGQGSSRRGSAVDDAAPALSGALELRPDGTNVDSPVVPAEEIGGSPRAARAHEHQKHIEWKEEDSQYMYRLIEKEFPVGNVVWSVIGEKMQSRGYSQTQCMSKWRRHLKNNKTPNDASRSGMSMDLDMDLELPNELRPNGYRRRGLEDRPLYSDPYTEGTKRFRRDGLDSRRYERSLDYNSVDLLDARMVEMEYDRYYDAGGKRRKTDDEGSQPPSELGYLYHRRSRSPPYEDYHGYNSDLGRRHPQDIEPASPRRPREYSQDAEVSGVAMSTRDANGSSQPPSSAAYGDEQHPPAPTSDPEHERDNGREEQQEEQSHNRGESQALRKHHNQPSSSIDDPQQWRDERREGRSADHGAHHSRHHHRSSSASSSYRDYYNPSHFKDDGISHNRPYSRGEPTLDNKDITRPKYRNSEQENGVARRRGSFIGEESDGRRKEAAAMDRDSLRPYDHTTEDIRNRSRHHKSRSSYDYDVDFGRHQNRYNARYSQRPRQDFDRGDSDFIDYAMEDEMEWAAGRWESRDMARLAAAVAKQGRRWDAIRAQIRIPVLVSPYEDMDNDIYDGTRFDPYPSNYNLEEMRRTRHRYHHRHQRSSSNSASRDYRDSHRYLSSYAARYEPSREPVASMRPPTASDKRAYRSEKPTLKTSPAISAPVEVDLTMENAEDEADVNSSPSTFQQQQQQQQQEEKQQEQQQDRVEEDRMADVVSTDNNADKVQESEQCKDETSVNMKETVDGISEPVETLE
ncbi:hypothetical protein BGX21_001271 [Mortierella sp. AD011]|nr:hypothetical protein BGX20_001155 [Mortierella sp. AD010]KAF9384560.1 hypothetical protein BGX21_001271 [Mortierella sp. AD011]